MFLGELDAEHSFQYVYRTILWYYGNEVDGEGVFLTYKATGEKLNYIRYLSYPNVYLPTINMKHWNVKKCIL